MNIPLTEQEEARRGSLLATILKIRQCKRHPGCYQTLWGSKNALGLYRVIDHIVKYGE